MKVKSAAAKFIPIANVDQAVRRIKRWGCAEDRAAFGAATNMTNPQASRQAIIDITAKIKRPARPTKDY
jgi:hypothetical protein